jgi:hypothetical protein
MRVRKNRTVSALKALSCIAVIALLFSLIWLRTSVTRIEYKLSDLEKQKIEALRVQKAMVAQKASLVTLTRVERTDLTGRGFSFPERQKVVYVKGMGEAAPSKVSYNTH